MEKPTTKSVTKTLVKAKVDSPLIYGKILKIMEQVQPVKKGGRVSFKSTNYSYQKAEDMVASIRELMIKEKVIVYPVGCNYGEGNTHPLTLISMAYRLMAVEDNSFLDVRIPAQGYDSGDKGVYKALTGAYKYMIKQTFMIESGEDDYDKDASPQVTQTTQETEEDSKGLRDSYVVDGVTYTYKEGVSQATGKPYKGYFPPYGSSNDKFFGNSKKEAYDKLQEKFPVVANANPQEVEEVDESELPF